MLDPTLLVHGGLVRLYVLVSVFHHYFLEKLFILFDLLNLSTDNLIVLLWFLPGVCHT